MSLVYEALRKAEREKERKNTPIAPVTPPPAPVKAPAPAPSPVAPESPASPNYMSVLIVCVSLVAVVAIAYMVMMATSRPVTLRAVEETPHVVEPTAPVVVPAPVVEPSAPRGPATTENDSRFKLTGIMGRPEGGFGAILNGRPVYEGHYVDGAIVKKIERDRVTLDLNGREIVVRLF